MEDFGSALGSLLVMISAVLAIILGMKEHSFGVGIISFFLLPWYLLGVILILTATLGIGCVFGLPVGIFYGVKNYMQSIRDNISNKTFKILMIVITWLIIIIFIFYLFAVTYFLYGYFN